MKDQYDNQIPDDLVLLDLDPWNIEDQKIAIDARWYDDPITHLIYVPHDDVKEIEWDWDESFGDLQSVDLLYINDCLKRYNSEDGFYHA